VRRRPWVAASPIVKGRRKVV